jgi:hypothetical protein
VLLCDGTDIGKQEIRTPRSVSHPAINLGTGSTVKYFPDLPQSFWSGRQAWQQISFIRKLSFDWSPSLKAMYTISTNCGRVKKPLFIGKTSPQCPWKILSHDCVVSAL